MAYAIGLVFFENNVLALVLALGVIILFPIPFLIVAVLISSALLKNKLPYKKKLVAQFIVTVVIGLMTFYILELRYSTFLFFESLNLQFSKEFQSECVKRAFPIPDGGKISICKSKRYDPDTAEAVIYDSSDQILKDYKHRTRDWNRTAFTLRKKAPFGSLGFKATKLFDHYYYVHFSIYTKMLSSENYTEFMGKKLYTSEEYWYFQENYESKY